ncbi:type II toxin-antitoxin system RelE/ParE family toxin [Acetobacter estunensis]|uniref:type II toxin-antitoxin system RelE/ParE family toxin n=1 Tax=Acetobacter estunensis TaxID=104097 RepID=UPI001C2DBC93|nr:type II toxin-antitoxin system RelE/ParE family toxin [Acetobacter estunensis]MBV1835747.1 type II toxin-antitoxin system RelE/ParE family toxin [Acetobacter estunensis]MBV1835992.1 type II toxin-antitoxin system RelE/ParE family toxin [Acetobacter estunensis]
MASTRKPIEFVGTALADLREFPPEIMREMGYELALVQEGCDPSDWKPMAIVGPGVKEIRVSGEDGIYRSLYVANFGDKVYVLHCFQKKSQKTPQRDIDLASKRLGTVCSGLRKATKKAPVQKGKQG